MGRRSRPCSRRRRRRASRTWPPCRRSAAWRPGNGAPCRARALSRGPRRSPARPSGRPPRRRAPPPRLSRARPPPAAAASPPRRGARPTQGRPAGGRRGPSRRPPSHYVAPWSACSRRPGGSRRPPGIWKPGALRREPLRPAATGPNPSGQLPGFPGARRPSAGKSAGYAPPTAWQRRRARTPPRRTFPPTQSSGPSWPAPWAGARGSAHEPTGPPRPPPAWARSGCSPTG